MENDPWHAQWPDEEAEKIGKRAFFMRRAFGKTIVKLAKKILIFF